MIYVNYMQAIKFTKINDMQHTIQSVPIYMVASSVGLQMAAPFTFMYFLLKYKCKLII